MNTILLVILVYIFVFLPVTIIQLAILYDAFFQNNDDPLVRMLSKLPKKYQEIAEGIRSAKQKQFFSFFRFLFLFLNIFLFIAFYFVYIREDGSKLAYLDRLFIILIILGIFATLYFIFSFGEDPTIVQWKAILEDVGIDVKNYILVNVNNSEIEYSNIDKVYILSRSFFKKLHPETYVSLLPYGSYRIFSFTQKFDSLSNDMIGSKSVDELIKLPQFYLNPRLKKELILCDLWIQRFTMKKRILIVLLILISLSFTGYTISKLDHVSFDLNLPPDDNTSFLISLFISVICIVFLSVLYFLYEIINPNLLQFILNQNNIIYDKGKGSMDYFKKLLDLIESKFPYQNLRTK